LIYDEGGEPFADALVKFLSETRTIIKMDNLGLKTFTQYENNSPAPQSAVIMFPENLDPNFLLSYSRCNILFILSSEDEAFRWISKTVRKTGASSLVALVLEPIPSYFTWHPYQNDECENVTRVFPVASEDIFKHHEITSGKDCVLKSMSSLFPPYVTYNNTGVEQRIFADIAKKLNMIPENVFIDGREVVWTISENDSVILEDKFDVMFSSLRRSLLYAKFLDFLPSHTQDSLSFFVPSPDLAPRSIALYRSFLLETWLLFIISTIMIFAAGCLLTYFEDDVWNFSIMPTLLISLNLPSAVSKKNSIKFLAVSAYFYSFHITTAYQAALITFLSEIPRLPAISSVRELGESSLPVIVHSSLMSDFEMRMKDSPNYLTLQDQVQYPNGRLHSNIMSHKNVSLLGSSMSRSIDFRSYYDEFMYPLVHKIPTEHWNMAICFYLSKGHPLFHLMTKYTYYLVEAGLPKKYHSPFLNRPKVHKRMPKEPFGLSNLEGAFYLLMLLLTISFFVWSVEQLYFYYIGVYCLQKRCGKPSNRGDTEISSSATLSKNVDSSMVNVEPRPVGFEESSSFGKVGENSVSLD